MSHAPCSLHDAGFSLVPSRNISPERKHNNPIENPTAPQPIFNKTACARYKFPLKKIIVQLNDICHLSPATLLRMSVSGSLGFSVIGLTARAEILLLILLDIIKQAILLLLNLLN